MSKGIDIVPLIEWAIKRGPDPDKPVRTRNKTEKPVNIFELIQAKRQEAQLLENYLKEMEKINKKEEKKEGFFQKFTTQQLTMMLLLIPPYVLILQQALLKH